MSPLILLLLGLTIVLGGILWLRLPPFLALIAGALIVGAVTTKTQVQESMYEKYLGDARRSAIQDEVVELAKGSNPSDGQAVDFAALREQAKASVATREADLQASADKKARDFANSQSFMGRILSALGATFQKVGLIIAMACVVGRCLLASGAAERVVRSALALVGERGAPLAFSASSFFLSIPVFFDSTFLLVIPLAKALWLKLRKNYVLFILALVAGGTMTHSLVPPTPGPLFVAEELGVNIGLMILVGMAVGVCSTTVGLGYASWLNARLNIPVRDDAESLAKLEALASRDEGELPSLWWALLPVVLPVVMISGATILKSGLSPVEEVSPILALMGDKNFALVVAAVASYFVAAAHMRDRSSLAEQLRGAVEDAGPIILVCCAGGAFGAILQQSGIGQYIVGLTGTEPLDFGLLPMAFIVTAVIRGAQGSATVAMFTAVAIVGSLCPDLATLSYNPVYLAVAIGCGSKPFPWMNDSGFWVVSRMTGMTERETLQSFTPLLTIMGFTGIAVTMLAAKLLPLI